MKVSCKKKVLFLFPILRPYTDWLKHLSYMHMTKCYFKNTFNSLILKVRTGKATNPNATKGFTLSNK